MLTRREFGKMAFAGLALPRIAGAAINPIVNGVRLGAQTYSFRDLPRTPGGDAIEPIIRAMADCGIGECELWAPQVEPVFPSGARGAPGAPPSPEALKAREDARKWRLAHPPPHG